MTDARGDIFLPPHVYIPGQTERHPEDLFDAIKHSVTPDLAPDALAQTEAFRAGLLYLEQGYFWECHEVLEAVWMRTADGTSEREMVQALIQLANARLKMCMGRPRAVVRLVERVNAHLDRCPGSLPILGVPPRVVRQWASDAAHENARVMHNNA